MRLLRTLISRIPLAEASGNFRLIWDVIQLIIIMAFQFFLPLYITFKVPFYEILPSFLAYSIFFLLFFDIFVNMNTSYFEKGR